MTAHFRDVSWVNYVQSSRKPSIPSGTEGTVWPLTSLTVAPPPAGCWQCQPSPAVTETWVSWELQGNSSEAEDGARLRMEWEGGWREWREEERAEEAGQEGLTNSHSHKIQKANLSIRNPQQQVS